MFQAICQADVSQYNTDIGCRVVTVSKYCFILNHSCFSHELCAAIHTKSHTTPRNPPRMASAPNCVNCCRIGSVKRPVLYLSCLQSLWMLDSSGVFVATRRT